MLFLTFAKNEMRIFFPMCYMDLALGLDWCLLKIMAKVFNLNAQTRFVFDFYFQIDAIPE